MLVRYFEQAEAWHGASELGGRISVSTGNSNYRNSWMACHNWRISFLETLLYTCEMFVASLTRRFVLGGF